jgi:hypothetical protein
MLFEHQDPHELASWVNQFPQADAVARRWHGRRVSFTKRGEPVGVLAALTFASNSRIFCLQRDKLVGGRESNEEIHAEQKRCRPDPHQPHQTEHPRSGVFFGERVFKLIR